MTVTIALLLCGLGLAVATLGHVATKVAERRARDSYRELVGPDQEPPQDGWQEIGPLAGRWGCLMALLEFMRGIGVALAVGSALYLVVEL